MPPNPRPRVLVVDDDEPMNALICEWLRGITLPDFEPVSSYSVSSAIETLAARDFDVVLLDRRLGDGDGVDVLRFIRAHPATRHLPVLILSGLTQEKEVISGLGHGADDYLPKPCTEELFRARLLAVLRRNRLPEPRSPLIDGPGFQLDPRSGRLFVDGRVEHLEPKETEILLLLLRRPNTVHSQAFLCQEVWGKTNVPHNTLESRLSSLRRKLGPRAENLETVRGSGYRLLR